MKQSQPTQGQWTIKPAMKKQAGCSQYMILVAPNGKVMGMFYDSNIAKELVKKINNHDKLLEHIKTHCLVRSNE